MVAASSRCVVVVSFCTLWPGLICCDCVAAWLCGGVCTCVYVWVQGTAGSPWYNGTMFANLTESVVVVINYRVGALGFASLGAGAPINGSYGYLDQMCVESAASVAASVLCGCVAVWLCAAWLCGCVAVWLCGCGHSYGGGL